MTDLWKGISFAGCDGERMLMIEQRMEGFLEFIPAFRKEPRQIE
jgi:hypothetical protein